MGTAIKALRPVCVCVGIVSSWSFVPALARFADAAEVPRIDSVVMFASQPQQADGAAVWYDDFDGPAKAYTESQGPLDDQEGFGGQGRALRCLYEQGKRGVGNRKVFFGDSPTGKVVRKGESFDDIYWRIYVKFHRAWDQCGLPRGVLECGIARDAVAVDRQFRYLDRADRPGRLPPQSGLDQDSLRRVRSVRSVGGRNCHGRPGWYAGVAIEASDDGPESRSQ